MSTVVTTEAKQSQARFEIAKDRKTERQRDRRIERQKDRKTDDRW